MTGDRADGTTKPGLGDDTGRRPLAAIGIDGSCYDRPDLRLAVDEQGWNADHAIFEKVFQRHRPRLVCEIGTWKGASVFHMHALAKAQGLPTHFICVDTWLGSNDLLWLDPGFRKLLRLTHGYPDIFRQFIRNVIARDAQKDISPFPITSSAAARVFRKLNIEFDAVYIDAGHEEEEVYADLALYYDLVVEGGAIFGDDYDPSWPGVVRAVDAFCHRKNLRLETGTNKFYFAKRASFARTVMRPFRSLAFAARAAVQR